MKARALNRPLRQLPAQQFLDTDDINDVLSIMRELRQGHLNRAALLCDAIEGDDRIKAVQETRIGALRATPLDVKPGNQRRIARKLADQLGGVDDAPGEWDRIFPAGIIGDLCRWGDLLGIGVAEILWTTEARVWTPRLRIWHPQWVRWDWAADCYKILTWDGEIELPRLDENPNGDSRWMMWCPYGYREGYKHGLIRSLARLYIMRGWDYRDWARWNELKGLGIIKAILPDRDNEDDDEAFLDDIANRGSEPVIPMRQGAEGNRYDLQHAEDAGGAEGWKSFQEFKRALDVDIAVLWLGQNLSTESPANGSSSKSLGEVQRATTLDRLKVDAGIANACYDQVLIPWVRLNTPAAAAGAEGNVDEITPRPTYVTEPPKDQLAEATAMKMTGDGIAALKGAGVPVDERQVGEQFGIPMKTEEEVAAEKAVAAEEAAAAMEAQRAAAPSPAAHPGQATAPGGARPPVPGQKAALRLPTDPAPRMVCGLPVVVEHRAGSTRLWRDAGPDGGQVIGSTKMLHDYGYIDGVMGSDGEELDVYVGPNPEPSDVYVVHQRKAPDFTAHDEDKTMLGFSSADEARASYVAHRNDGDRAIGGMSVIPLDVFKRKLETRRGGGKIRATATPAHVTVDAIMRLFERGQRPLAALKSRAKKQEYTDRLTSNAVRLAAKTLAVDIAGLTGVVRAAQNPQEALKMIEAYYRDKMDPARFARIVQKVRLMSHLAGGADVHGERAA